MCSFEYKDRSRMKTYAWIKQIADSRVKKANWIMNAIIEYKGEKANSEIDNIPNNPRKMCPAVIFPASRIARVKGRIRVLINSMMVRKGIIHSGAPAGPKCARVAFRLWFILEIISINQIGSASVVEK